MLSTRGVRDPCLSGLRGPRACGVDSIEPLDVPDGWDDSYEYAMDDKRIWSRLTRLAMDAYLAHAILEVTLVPVDDEEADADSRALLYRFTWPY